MAPCYRNLNTKGFFFLQLRGDSGQEKRLRSPERGLCSQGMSETRRPTVHHNQCPYTPRYMLGGGGLPDPPVSPKCFYFFCGCGQIKVGGRNFSERHTVSLVFFNPESVWVHMCSVYFTIYFYVCVCVCFNREAKAIRAYLDFLVLPVTVARKATG